MPGSASVAPSCWPRSVRWCSVTGTSRPARRGCAALSTICAVADLGDLVGSVVDRDVVAPELQQQRARWRVVEHAAAPRPRCSQPWQNGQWKTESPQRSSGRGRRRSGSPSRSPAARVLAALAVEREARLGAASPCLAELDARVLGRALLGPWRRSRRGGVPSLPSSPPMPCAGRLLWPPASITSVLRRARPRTSAALSPAAPPPTMMQSQVIACERDADRCSGKHVCHAGKRVNSRTPASGGGCASCRTAPRADPRRGRRAGATSTCSTPPAPGGGQAPARPRPHPGPGAAPGRDNRRAARTPRRCPDPRGPQQARRFEGMTMWELSHETGPGYAPSRCWSTPAARPARRVPGPRGPRVALRRSGRLRLVLGERDDIIEPARRSSSPPGPRTGSGRSTARSS